MVTKVAVESGYSVSSLVEVTKARLRLRNLGITDIHLGTDKVETLRNMLNYII
jgi:hypothetical protein